MIANLFCSNQQTAGYSMQQELNPDEITIPKITKFKRGSYHVGIAYFIQCVKQASEHIMNERHRSQAEPNFSTISTQINMQNSMRTQRGDPEFDQHNTQELYRMVQMIQVQEMMSNMPVSTFYPLL